MTNFMERKKIIFLPGLRFHVENYINYLDESFTIYIFTSSPKKLFLSEKFKYIFIPQPFKIITRLLKIKSNTLFKLFDSITYQIISSIIIFFINPSHIHAWGGYGFIIFKLFNRKKIILERSSSYELTQHTIIKNEYIKLGIRQIFNIKFNKLRFIEYYLCNNIVIPSSYVYETFPKNLRKKLNLIYPISKNLSTDFSHNYIDNNKPIVIGYVGGNIIVKGLFYLLNQFNNLKDPHKLYLKLDKSDYSNHKLFKNFIDNNKNIEVKKTDRNMSQFYNSVDCLIQPSVDDGFQMVIIEALSLGIPCFVSKFSGSKDLMENLLPENIFNPHSESEIDNILSSLNKKKLNDQSQKVKKNFNNLMISINDSNQKNYKNILI